MASSRVVPLQLEKLNLSLMLKNKRLITSPLQVLPVTQIILQNATNRNKKTNTSISFQILLQCPISATEPAYGRPTSVHMRGATRQGPLCGLDQPRQLVRELPDAAWCLRLLHQWGAGQSCCAEAAIGLSEGAFVTCTLAVRHWKVRWSFVIDSYWNLGNLLGFIKSCS